MYVSSYMHTYTYIHIYNLLNTLPMLSHSSIASRLHSIACWPLRSPLRTFYAVSCELDLKRCSALSAVVGRCCCFCVLFPFVFSNFVCNAALKSKQSIDTVQLPGNSLQRLVRVTHTTFWLRLFHWLSIAVINIAYVCAAAVATLRLVYVV